METAVDQNWVFQRFGALGKLLSATVTETLVDCHNEHADGQAMIKSRNRRAYGTVSYTVQERLVEALAGKEGVEFRRLGKGKPRVLMVNGTILVQWRYSKSAVKDLLERKYGTSESRIATFQIPIGPQQGVFDLGQNERVSLTPEETELVETLRALSEAESREHHRVVVIAYASDARALHKVLWADAALNDDGTLKVENLQLLFNADAEDVVVSSDRKRFDQQPRREFGLAPKYVNE